MNLVIEYKIQLLNYHDILEDIYLGFHHLVEGLGRVLPRKRSKYRWPFAQSSVQFAQIDLNPCLSL